jgi:hypothetical protein
LFEFEGNNSRSHSHVNLEFLREFTRSAVSTDGSDLEPVDVTSDKVVESVARGLSSSDDSGVSLGDEFGTSELSVISSAIGCGSNILSEPKFETSVGKGVPFEDNLLSNSRLDSRSAKGGRSTGKLDSADHGVARKSTSVLVASLSSDLDVSSRSEVEGSNLKRSHGDLAGLKSRASSSSDRSSTSLVSKTVKATPLVLVGENFEGVGSDGRTTVGRSGPGECDVTSARNGVQAHRARYGSQRDTDQARPSSPSARVLRANLVGVSLLSSRGKSNSSSEISRGVDGSVSLASAVNALVHLVRGSSSKVGVSESNTSCDLVDNSESGKRTTSGLHGGSELSRGSGRIEGASSLVAGGGSSDDLCSIGEVVTSSGKFSHGNGAAVGFSSDDGRCVESGVLVLESTVELVTEGGSSAVVKADVSSLVSSAHEDSDLVGEDWSTSIARSNPGDVNRASVGDGLWRFHLARDGEVRDSSDSRESS